MRKAMDRRKRPVCRPFTILCLGAALLGGGAGNGGAETPGTTAPHIASIEGGVEAAIDAPWRIEPDYTSSFRYPQIPIVVSIHDTSLQSTQGYTVALGQFCEMLILEEPGSFGPDVRREVFTADRLTEVERSDKWPISSAPASNHRLCRRWAGETCSASDLDVGPSAEWHGTVLYRPREQTRGNEVRLTVQVRVAQAGQSCGAPREAVHAQAPFDRFALAPEGNAYLIVNRLQVHLGEDPLPRFDDEWAYGDLHYHSQGTDNEGESAYAYRPTLQAMRAMGLDFLFATEHASDSEQITDVNLVYLRNIDVPDWIPFDEDIEDFVESIPLHEELRTYAARDMNQQRFEALRALLNDLPGFKDIAGHIFPTGANAEVMKLPGAKRPARIFLGGEIDVVPEMSASEKTAGMVSYGNGVGYRWRNCLLDPKVIEEIHKYSTSLFCPSPDNLAELDPATGRYLVHDIQGLGDDSFYSRQHMVYLPTDGTRSDAFVSGDTSQFGGAHERLSDLLRPDYYRTIVGKGYAFLAHPADADSGTSLTRLGPDIVPYSDLQLRTAFESPAILGLQLWNEDTRLRSNTTTSVPGFPLQSSDAGPAFTRWHWGSWVGATPQRAYTELHHGLLMWDKMLLWGIRPSQTAGLQDADGLPLGPDRPRRVFMAGGSDAHGDLNYRRQGRLFGLSSIVDTAIGKPRNLVHVGPSREETVADELGQPHGVVGQGQATEALARGNFAVTDGPALRIAVDANSNGIIDGPDDPMGGVNLTPWRGKYVPFVVEWKSTDEFGPLAGIDLYVGVTSDALDLGFVYAAENHGIHSPTTRSGRVGPNRYVDGQGGTHPELWDGYMLDPTGKLHITLTAAEAKAGSRMVFLRPDDFVVGRRRIAQEEPVCRPNIWCTRPGYPELCEEECSEPPPPTYHFDNMTVPDRIYVRAFARTTPKGGAYCAEQAPDISDRARIEQKTGQCIERLAFTNPVWVDNSAAPPPGDFGITCTPASLTIPNAGSRTTTCTLTSTNGFTNPVSLGCSGLPSGVTCAFSPATVTPPTNGSVSSTLTTSVGLTPQGSYTFRAEGTVTTVHRRHASIALTVSGSQVRNLMATYDPARQAPSCVPSKLGGSCDTGPSLVFGRGAGAAEQNASNTIGGTCADGEATPKTTGRWNANDRIRVSTYDGTDFATGKVARIEATVFALNTSIDAADFYYAADAANPSWTLIGTVVPTATGAQTLSTSYRLPAGGVQAVRVQFRQGGDNAPSQPAASTIATTWCSWWIPRSRPCVT